MLAAHEATPPAPATRDPDESLSDEEKELLDFLVEQAVHEWMTRR